MKAKEMIIASVLRIAFTMICGSVIYPSVSASGILQEHGSGSSTPIVCEGDWRQNVRSLLLSPVPFTASTNGYTLYIQNATPNCDISIRIVDETSQTVLEKVVSKDASSYIVIPIDALQDGYYTLEIRNAAGGYVYGGFIKDTDSF